MVCVCLCVCVCVRARACVRACVRVCVCGLIHGSDVTHVRRAPSQINVVASHSKQVVPTPVSPDVLQCMLQGYDVVKTKYLVNGFAVGFNIGCLWIPVQTDTTVLNMKSAFQFPQVIDDKLMKEQALGRVLGPFKVHPQDPDFRGHHLAWCPRNCLGSFV